MMKLTASAVEASFVVTSVANAEVWLGAVDPWSQLTNAATVHFMDLFSPNAGWSTMAPANEIALVIKFLRRRHIRETHAIHNVDPQSIWR